MTAQITAAKTQSQSDKFKEAARDLDCDEDDGHWEERLRDVTKHKPDKAE